MQPRSGISVQGISHSIGARKVIDGMTLHLEGARTGIIGRNGSGKSTLARLLAGLVTPEAGSVLIDAVDVAHDRRAAISTVGILFQNPEHQIIFPTVEEEVAFGLRQQGLNKAEARDQVAATLAAFGKPHWSDAATEALSQGQKHLLCIMAVMAMRPRWLILDEPFAGLDIPTRMQLTRHLGRSQTRLVHISHEPRDLAGYEHICWLDGGRIRAAGGLTILDEFEAEMIREGTEHDLADLAG